MLKTCGCQKKPISILMVLKHNCCFGHKKFLLRYIKFHYKVAVQCVVSSYQIILPLLFWRWERLLDYSHISSVRCLACNLCCTRTTDISINNWQQQVPPRRFIIILSTNIYGCCTPFVRQHPKSSDLLTFDTVTSCGVTLKAKCIMNHGLSISTEELKANIQEAISKIPVEVNRTMHNVSFLRGCKNPIKELEFTRKMSSINC